jgi:hypothetical protein
MNDKPDNISLRDWFAGMALSGFCANRNTEPEYDEDFDKIANVAFSTADAMLEYVDNN